jgi:hypothetical protein
VSLSLPLPLLHCRYSDHPSHALLDFLSPLVTLLVTLLVLLVLLL